MRRIPVILMFLVPALMMPTVSYGTSSSASYIITIDEINSSIGDISSAAYRMFCQANGLYSALSASSAYGMGGGFIYTVFPQLALLVTSVSPNSGYNTGSINISEIAGAGFASGAAVKLTKNGESDISATEVNVVSPSKITCRFDLTGKTTGLWNLVVANSNGLSGTLPSAFTINTWATLTQMVNYPNPFDPLAGPTTIVYKLEADTEVSLLIFNISHELIAKREYSAGSEGGKAGDNSITWDGRTAFGEMAANGVYFCRLIDRSKGKLLAKGKIAVSR